MGFAEFQTMEKFGANASNVKGAITMMFGDPVYMTRWLTSDLASTGLYTGSGATTSKVIADLDAFATYVRRGLVLKSQEDIKTGQTHLVGSVRKLWSTPDSASAKNVHVAYNLS